MAGRKGKSEDKRKGGLAFAAGRLSKRRRRAEKEKAKETV
jgi:hypothetical protein